MMVVVFDFGKQLHNAVQFIFVPNVKKKRCTVYLRAEELDGIYEAPNNMITSLWLSLPRTCVQLREG